MVIGYRKKKQDNFPVAKPKGMEYCDITDKEF